MVLLHQVQQVVRVLQQEVVLVHLEHGRFISKGLHGRRQGGDNKHTGALSGIETVARVNMKDTPPFSQPDCPAALISAVLVSPSILQSVETWKWYDTTDHHMEVM